MFFIMKMMFFYELCVEVCHDNLARDVKVLVHHQLDLVKQDGVYGRIVKLYAPTSSFTCFCNLGAKLLIVADEQLQQLSNEPVGLRKQ